MYIRDITKYGWTEYHKPHMARAAINLEGIALGVNFAGEQHGVSEHANGALSRAKRIREARRDPWGPDYPITPVADTLYTGYTCPANAPIHRRTQRREDYRLYLEPLCPYALNPARWRDVVNGGDEALIDLITPGLQGYRMVPMNAPRLSMVEVALLLWQNTPPLTFALLWDLHAGFRRAVEQLVFLPADPRLVPPALFGGYLYGSKRYRISPYMRVGVVGYDPATTHPPKSIADGVDFKVDRDMVLAPYISPHAWDILEDSAMDRDTNRYKYSKNRMYRRMGVNAKGLIEYLCETGPLTCSLYRELPDHYICNILLHHYGPFTLAMVRELDFGRFNRGLPLIPREWLDDMVRLKTGPYRVNFAGRGYRLNP